METIPCNVCSLGEQIFTTPTPYPGMETFGLGLVIFVIIAFTTPTPYPGMETLLVAFAVKTSGAVYFTTPTPYPGMETC